MEKLNEDNVFYSDPGGDSASSVRNSRKLPRRKPNKMEDFREGKIRKWNEFFVRRGSNMVNKGGRNDEENNSFWNKKRQWKVYTRCSNHKQLALAKGNIGKSITEDHNINDWQGLEEQHVVSSQSSYSSSSENSESDNEAFDLEDVDTEKKKAAGEEAGYEGVRCLLGSQVMELGVKPTNAEVRVDSPR